MSTSKPSNVDDDGPPELITPKSSPSEAATKTAKKDEKKTEQEEEEKPLIMVMKRHKVVGNYNFGDGYQFNVTLREYEGCNDVDGAVAIEGFASQTLASMLATGFVADQLKLPVIGCIDSPSIPGKVLIDLGEPAHPIRILGNKDLVIFQCEFQIVSPEMNYYIAQAVADFVKRHRCPVLITMEGMPTSPDDMKDETDVAKLRYITTDDKMSVWLKEHNHIPIQNAIIPGFSGLLLALASNDADFNIAALMVKSNKLFPDSGAAVILVKCLDQYLDHIPLNTSELEKKSRELEVQVKRLLKKAGSASDRPAGMYM